MAGHPLYKLWLNVKDRCRNPRNPYFHNYGGRGIKMCEAWAQSFPVFLMGIGPRPTDRHSLDRINNDGNYEPGNVRWATKRDQANNQRKNRVLTLNGRSQTLAQWAKEIGMAPSALHYRIHQGRMTQEQALTTPSQRGRKLVQE